MTSGSICGGTGSVCPLVTLVATLENIVFWCLLGSELAGVTAVYFLLPSKFVRPTSPLLDQDNKQKYGKRGPPRPFPVDLFEILRTEDPAVIGWFNAQRPLSSSTSTTECMGRLEEGFSIRDPERFCIDIIPRYFDRRELRYGVVGWQSAKEAVCRGG